MVVVVVVVVVVVMVVAVAVVVMMVVVAADTFFVVVFRSDNDVAVASARTVVPQTRDKRSTPLATRPENQEAQH